MRTLVITVAEEPPDLEEDLGKDEPGSIHGFAPIVVFVVRDGAQGSYNGIDGEDERRLLSA